MANVNGRSFKLKCQNCNKEFEANTSNTKYCNECDIKLNYNKCVICGKLVRKKICCSKECLAIHRSKNNPSKREDVRQKLKETALKGLEVAKKSNLEKYGVEYPFQRKEIQEKVRETQRNNNDGKLAWNTDKQKETMLKRYGATHNMKVPELVNKQKETWLKTLQEKYNCNSPMQVKEFRKKAFRNSNVSSLEKKTKEFLDLNHIKYEHQYIIEKNNKSHAYDFGIFNNENKLVMLVECDGKYYHGYMSDANGKHVHDEIDTQTIIDLIPENVKFVKIIENDFNKGIEELVKALGFDYDKYIEDLFNWCRSIEFPYPTYKDTTLKTSFNQLLSYKPENNLNIKVGNKIIKHFHRSIYHCYTYNKPSAYEAWNNDNLLRKCIKNRFIYKDYIDPSRVLAGFTINKIAPIPKMFSPFISKYLINKYLNEFETIFDPFSGYSGRMLGAIANNKNYIGQDINKETINESNQIIEYFNLQNKASIKEQDIIKDSYKNYDCLFTCPPYNLKENWNNKNQLNLSCDKWIDICLSTYNCKKYLFVVDKTEKYKDNVVEEIVNKSHLGENTEKIILIKGDESSNEF